MANDLRVCIEWTISFNKMRPHCCYVFRHQKPRRRCEQRANYSGTADNGVDCLMIERLPNTKLRGRSETVNGTSLSSI